MISAGRPIATPDYVAKKKKQIVAIFIVGNNTRKIDNTYLQNMK